MIISFLIKDPPFLRFSKAGGESSAVEFGEWRQSGAKADFVSPQAGTLYHNFSCVTMKMKQVM
jgi:hypothetical protein